MKIQVNIINVEVVYALPHEQQVFYLSVHKSMTIENIIKQSGILKLYPEINFLKNKIGIFGRNVTLDSKAQNEDRIEIYRPLLGDPKEIRIKRIKQNRK
ncbi:hypothetical protein CF66_9003 [Candidatus Photodesmus katoptron]|nr:RnfH family protein [Candidatus Photodesmus katoptron]KEY89973.1 hypothetical protein CF66_9003 [Candidatus Photodesmus katoptron]